MRIDAIKEQRTIQRAKTDLPCDGIEVGFVQKKNRRESVVVDDGKKALGSKKKLTPADVTPHVNGTRSIHAIHTTILSLL